MENVVRQYQPVVQQPNTPNIVAAQARFITAVAAWKTLSPADKASWSQFYLNPMCNAAPLANYLVNPIVTNLTGYQAFMSLYCNCLEAGITPPTLAPQDNSTPLPPTLLATWTNPNIVCNCTASGPKNKAEIWLLVYHGIYHKQIAIVADTASPTIDISQVYEASPTPVPLASLAFPTYALVQAVALNTYGIKSAPSTLIELTIGT